MSWLAGDIAFIPAVKRMQVRKRSRAAYARPEDAGEWKTAVTEGLIRFIAKRDHLYFGTASAEGQPHIQLYCGNPGFLKVLSAQTLAFAEARHDRRYISAGNLSENDQAFLLLLDDAGVCRVKIRGCARIVDDDSVLCDALSDASSNKRPNHAILLRVSAWDVAYADHVVPYCEPGGGD